MIQSESSDNSLPIVHYESQLALENHFRNHSLLIETIPDNGGSGGAEYASDKSILGQIKTKKNENSRPSIMKKLLQFFKSGI